MTQTDEIVQLLRDVLGADLIGAYAHGSAVLGGLRPHSDVDVLAVSRRPTTAEERWKLVERLFEFSGARALRGPARPVELTVVLGSEIRPWRYPPRSEFQYGEWLRSDLERTRMPPSPRVDPDLAPLITMVLRCGTALFGPPPAEILDPVPRDDLRRAIVAGVPDLLTDLAEDTRNVVLTLARIWATLTTDEIWSKDAAAEWVLGRLPEEHRPVLARARAVYLGHEDERWDDLRAHVRPHAEHVVAEIERESRVAGDHARAG